MTARRLGIVGVVLLLLALGLGAVLVLGSRSPSGPEASPVAGDPVPAVTGRPLARIAVAGDTGTGDAAEAATVQEMVDQQRNGPAYDALLLLGDLVYEEGDADQVDTAVTEPFAPLLDSGTLLVPVLGNHDYESGEQTEIMQELGRDRSWYEQRVGPVRLLVLDSERVEDPAQQQWLQDALASPQPSGTWTIAAMHHPAYSAGDHGSTAAVQEHWVPLFSRYDVPLVLAGHDHDYQRSKPLDGVTYVVSGGGAKLRPTGREDFTAVSASTLHFVDLLVYRDRIEARAIDQSGRLLDAFTLTH